MSSSSSTTNTRFLSMAARSRLRRDRGSDRIQWVPRPPKLYPNAEAVARIHRHLTEKKPHPNAPLTQRPCVSKGLARAAIHALDVKGQGLSVPRLNSLACGRRMPHDRLR